MLATEPANDAGLFGTLRARSNEKTTSSAVKSLPSWNFTLSRSLISHVVGSIARHDTASAGCNWLFASLCTRRSKIWPEVL